MRHYLLALLVAAIVLSGLAALAHAIATVPRHTTSFAIFIILFTLTLPSTF